MSSARHWARFIWLFLLIESSVVMNGTSASIYNYPYVAMYGGFCGATIIDQYWLLTAAHCYGDRVMVGSDTMQMHDKKVIAAFDHPEYEITSENDDYVSADKDFQLLRLEEPLDLGPTVAIAELYEHRHVTSEKIAKIAAFGKTAYDGTMSTRLMKARFSVLADDDCKKKLPDYNRSSMICAKGIRPHNSALCHGDSGSGLIIDGKVAGVASWVEKDNMGCFPGTVAVFSRVAYAVPWIRYTMDKYEADSDINKSEITKLSNRIKKHKLKKLKVHSWGKYTRDS